jgi:hypothetical protein
MRANLIIPAKYFIDRGFNADILDKYDVGFCNDPRDQYNFNRVVVPIYDEAHKFIVGNTSRSIYDKCLICGTWHSPKESCPLPDNAWKFPKWKHSYKFKKEEHLYNYWFAQQHIKNTRVAILTESPGNIWRLEEAGISVGLATLGADFSDGQKFLLNNTGAMSIIIIMDNDEAGLRCSKEIAQVCKNTYKIYTFVPPQNDIGDMTVEEVQNTILPLYQQCVKEW